METKKDNKRNYNVFFNTHTVSGIVVAIVLYVIFLAGGFSFFRDEIDEWEFNRVTEKEEQAVILDFDKIIKNIINHTDHELYGRDLSFRVRGDNISIRGSKSFDTIFKDEAHDTILIKNNKRISINLDKKTLLPPSKSNQVRNILGGSNSQAGNTTNSGGNRNQIESNSQTNDSLASNNRAENTNTQRNTNQVGVSASREGNKNQIEGNTQTNDSLASNNQAENTNIQRNRNQTVNNVQREGRNQVENSTPTVDKSRLRGISNIIFRLHYLRQLDFGSRDIRWGRNIAGFASLLLLFATITGIIVHWKKIINTFYTFRVDLSLKKIWKDSHTVLGVITTPFLILYALTGVLFVIRSMTMTTDVQQFLFEGSREELNKVMSPPVIDKLEPLGKTLEIKSINSLINKVESLEDHSFNKDRIRVSIDKFGDKNATLRVYIYKEEDEKLFLGRGQYVFKIDTGELLYEDTLADNKYTASIRSSLNKLHFASFGGIFNRTLYFILTIVTCWVFLSGVLIWLGERKDNRKISPRRKIFNAEVTYIYLAVAFGLHIAIANGFILAKILPFDTLHVEQMRNSNYIHTRSDLLSVLFFTSWLLFSVFLYLLKNNYRIFKISLAFHGFLALSIPILNGAIDKQWVWISFQNKQMGSFFVDVFWFIMGVASIYMAIKIKEDSLPKRKVKTIAKTKSIEEKITKVRKRQVTQKP